MHAAHLVHSSVSFKNMTSSALLSIAHLRKSRLNNKANILHLKDIQAETLVLSLLPLRRVRTILYQSEVCVTS